jgi:DNA-binding transcriptional LysR family regulator
MWRTVDLQEVRVFLTLAEELHFGRTAERLQVTPSRVSQCLRALEHKLGAQLVHRTSRRVRLTPLGEGLLADLRPAHDQLEGVLERATAAARSLEGTLRFALLSGPAGGPHLAEIIGAFEKLHPECKVELVQVSWDDPFARLRERDVDAMATWIPLKEPDLVLGPILARQPRVLAVARDHPLAQRDSVDVEELADYRVPRFHGWPKEMQEAIAPFRTPSGREIPGSKFRVGERAVLDVSVRVARGEFVFLTVASAIPFMGELDLTFVPLTGMPPLRSALAWRRPARDPRLRAFLDVARSVLDEPSSRAGEVGEEAHDPAREGARRV